MNFKNILYNYKAQLLYANVLVPVRMGQTGRGIRTAFALRQIFWSPPVQYLLHSDQI